MSIRSTVDSDEVEGWFEEESSESPIPLDGRALDPAEKYARSQLRVVRETKNLSVNNVH